MSPNQIHSGNQLRTILKTAPWYLVSSILTKAASVILLPVMTRLLSPEEYGVLANLQSFIRLGSVFVSLYLDSAFSRFYFEENRTLTSLRTHVSTHFWIVVAWGGLVTATVTGVGLGAKLAFLGVPYYPLLLLVGLIPLMNQAALFGVHHLQNQLRVRAVSLLGLAGFAVSTGLSLALMIVWDAGLLGRVAGLMGSAFLTLSVSTRILVREGLLRWTFDTRMARRSLRFSVPLIPMAAASWITQLSDRLIVSIYAGVSEAGLFDVAYKAALALRMLTEAVFHVYGPMITSMYVHSKSEFSEKLGKFVTFFFWVMGVGVLFLCILARPLVRLFAAREYWTAASLVPILAIAYFISSHQKYLGAVFRLRKVTYLATIGYLLQAGLNLGLNLLFIPRFGKAAAAWSTFVSLLFLTIWAGYWFFHFETVRIEWGKLLRTCFVCGLAYGAHSCIVQLMNRQSLWTAAVEVAILAPGILILSHRLRIINFRELFARRGG